MRPPDTARAAPARADGGPWISLLAGNAKLDTAGVARDQRLLRLDFIGECGDTLVSLGAAISAASAAERLDVLEPALRQARLTLIEGITGSGPV